MLYEIEKLEEGEKYKFRLWIKQARGKDNIIYFDLNEKPYVDNDTLIVTNGEKLAECKYLYFALKFGDIVEERKE